MPSPNSWPCRGRPASSRSVSRAPSPAGSTPAASSASHTARRGGNRHCDLDPVLAGVTRAGDGARGARDLDALYTEALHGGGRLAELGHTMARFGALHGQDAPSGRGVLPAQRVHDALGVRRVGHHVEGLLVNPPHDDVVEHPAGVVEQVRVLRPARPDLAQVVGQRALQLIERVGAGDADSAEVADVEDHRRGATRAVFVERAARIGDGHQPAAELHELGAQRRVRVFEGRVTQGSVHVGRHRRRRRQRIWITGSTRRGRVRPSR